MQIIFKSNLEIKSCNKDGFFEGYANVFNEIDSQSDCVETSAFKNTLSSFKDKKYPPMYLEHDPAMPIGKWTLMEEDNYGLYVQGKLLFALPMALSVNALMQKRSIGLSVGIRVLKSKLQNGIRYISNAELCEISVTKMPANHKARVFI